MSRLLFTVSSGLGPIEVRRFVRLLSCALSREAQGRGLVLVRAMVHGEPDAPRSIDLELEGRRAAIADLLGTHALVQRSARREKRARKRWYVAVTCAEVAAPLPHTLRPEDVAIRACRSRGPGGQHVNRTESAVRAVHRPTGTAVRVDAERSQQRNRKRALAHLAATLAAEARVQQAATREGRRLRATHVERGNPVRTWRIDASGALAKGSDHEALPGKRRSTTR